jgi:hypothetical protein
VDGASIGANDLSVAGPGAVTVTAFSTQVNSDGSVRAVYTLSSPGGFTAADNGLHTLSLVAGAVTDLAGNGAPGSTLDTFAVNIAGSNLPQIGLDTTQAEALSTTNYAVVSLASAEGGQILRVPSGTGTAKGAFTGATGDYELTVAYYDENDGESTMSARVNGAVVASWSLDQNLGSPDAGPATLVTRAIPVSLATGAIIEITGNKAGGEHSRFDYLTVSPIIATAVSGVTDTDHFLI